MQATDQRLVDQRLVDQCRTGDQQAFAEIVKKYQTLVCSVAYAATGNLGASEELAQEAFVSAWQSMATLREPSKLRQWLCGITRNLANSHVRRNQRNVLSGADVLDQTEVSDAGIEDPASTTIAREEIELLNRTLATLPAQYREPMVLFYREDHSVARVAELLELSADNVKQRLARGRKMLRDEVATVVERGLQQSAPGRAFTIGVLSALPILTSTAKAATATVVSAKGVNAMNAAAWTGSLGAILGPLVGLLGAWFGYSTSMKSARSERERTFIKRMSFWMMGLIAVMTLGLTLSLIFGRAFIVSHPTGFAIGLITGCLGYIATIFSLVVWGNRRMAQIRREDGTVDADPAETAAKLPAVLRTFQYPRRYESKTRLLGLPLVSVQFAGASAIGRKQRRPAVGWIAIGDYAIGVLFASGSIAVGGVSIGALSFGLVSCGGLAVGALALGGGAIGWWALGGMAAGWLALGGVALAWKAAMGGLAVAHEIALGGLAVGEHTNNEQAKAFIADNPFFDLGNLMMTPWSWWILMAVGFVPMLLALRLVAPDKDPPAE